MKFFSAPFDWLEGFGINTAWLFVVLAFPLIYFAAQILDFESNKMVFFMFATAPVWLPIITFFLFFEAWMYYVRKEFDIQNGRTTLEIKLPEEILKSPEAMELVLIQLYQTASPDNHLQTYIDGKHPPTYGLEIVSRGGDIKFYMNVPRKKFVTMATTQLYAQYPGIEVKELEIDYMAEFPWDPKRFFYFSFHYGLKKADAYPIKTYVDWGLQAMPKEEEKVDPLTVMLETLGSVGPGENLFLQVLISAHAKQEFKNGSLKKKPDWQADVHKEIQAIIAEAKKRNETDDGNSGGVLQLTDGEKDTIKAMERSVSKYAFNTKFRTMYIAETDMMQPGERLGMLAGIFRQFDDITRNQIGIKWRTDTDWKWQDLNGKLLENFKKEELHEYNLRIMHQKRFGGDAKSILTTEEVATIFHFPGQVVVTPTLGRIPSTRSEAPSNLPVS